MHQSRSVTWVKIVQSKWLLVALSDSSTSTLCLWKLSSILLDESDPPPVAEVFLEGPVSNGLTEVQDGVLVVALELRTRLSVCLLVNNDLTQCIGLQGTYFGYPCFTLAPGYAYFRPSRQISRCRSYSRHLWSNYRVLPNQRYMYDKLNRLENGTNKGPVWATDIIVSHRVLRPVGTLSFYRLDGMYRSAD